MHPRFVSLLTALLLSLGIARAQDPTWYHRDSDWLATAVASREALAEWEASVEGHTDVPKPGPWLVSGPEVAPEGETAFSYPFSPEPRSEGQLADRAALGADGQPLWRAGESWLDGVVHNISAPGNASTFLLRTIEVPSERDVTLYLGSDDSLTVWWNGALVWSKPVPRIAAPNQDQVVVHAKAGANEVLLKVTNLSGGHGFYFSLEPNPGGSAGERRASLWPLLARDFPDAAEEIRWAISDGVWDVDWTAGQLSPLLSRFAEASPVERLREEARTLAAAGGGVEALRSVAARWLLARRLAATRSGLEAFSVANVRDAVRDLSDTFGERYAGGSGWLARLDELEGRKASSLAGLDAASEAALDEGRATLAALESLRTEALLANPLLDFPELLVVRRRGGHGLPQNWQGNSSIAMSGYDNELVVLSPVRPDGAFATRFRPSGGRYVGDLDLHWDATKMLLSMPDEGGQWQVWELPVGGGEPTLVTPSDQRDVANFDGCYLPDGRVIFCSTACYQGVPCVAGGDKVSLLYLLDRATGKVRQLTFDQDHSWDPFVLPNGRVLYERWEYGDLPHYFSRLLFTMNPDGTNQMAAYGSNSYWPNSLFYVRPAADDNSKLIGIVSGHHGERREGELLLFDPSRGEQEEKGTIQLIPGRGKPVEPTIADQLVAGSWPRFLHPTALSDKYFLVSCRPTPESEWGIYLADVFDNLVPVKIDPGWALLEATPLRPRTMPPALPDRVNPNRQDAVVYVADVYAGPGLAGVPRGTAKSLRVYSPHFTYPGVGGHINIGIDGPWDVHRILGTVPIDDDGSALFRVPANTPIAVQPLDERGQALQVMRTWMTAMPGETLTCSGCHEPQRQAVSVPGGAAAPRPVHEIAPWRGPTRGFSFKREVQPVLDRYCVSCHDGAPLDLRQGEDSQGWRGFTPSYAALHPYVRRPGPESDYHLQNAMEFATDTSELVRMLRKGHHGVLLDAEAWDRLITWIDLNVPCHGTWSEHTAIPGDERARRQELRELYGVRAPDTEDDLPAPSGPPAPEPRTPEPTPTSAPTCEGWPFAADVAIRMQAELGEARRSVDLGEGVTLEFVRIPAGRFVMGDPAGAPDEYPAGVVTVERPFWLSTTEVSNAQYARFDANHDSAVLSETNKDQDRRGIPLNGPTQPVLRVSWSEALAFSEWLGARAGVAGDLPTEAEWEWACRAGSADAFAFGALEADFAPFANLADRSLAGLARGDSPAWHPRDERFDDGATVTRPVGTGRANAWGLFDMHGNVCEWTRSRYDGYPYLTGDGRNEGQAADVRAVRGGSFYERPKDARSAWRWGYPGWRKVWNVGFRVALRD